MDKQIKKITQGKQNEPNRQKNHWQMVETVMQIPGIQRETTIMHVTDLHLTETDERDPKAMEIENFYKDVFDQQAPQPFSRKQHLEHVVAECNRLHVDALILTGDIVHYPSLASLDIVDQALGQLEAPYLYTLGNHDWHFPYLEWNEQTRTDYYPWFSRFHQGSLAFQSLTIAGVQLIAIDNSTYQIDESQLNHYHAALSAGKPCLLFMHIPVYQPKLAIRTTEVWTAPILMARAWHNGTVPTPSTLQFYELLEANPDQLLPGIFTGHVHFDFQEKLQGGTTQYVTPPGFAGHARIIRLIP